MKKFITRVKLFFHVNDDDLKIVLLIGIPWLLFSLWLVAKGDLNYLF
jgi:hypothetical protein